MDTDSDLFPILTNLPKPLSREDEMAIGMKARYGRTNKERGEAQKKLVEHNLRIVIKTAMAFQHDGIDLMDLIQEGAMGMMEAATMFDPKNEAGAKFATYAMHRVKKYLRCALSEMTRDIRLPHHVNQKHWHLSCAKSKFLEEKGREPTREELREITGITYFYIDNYLTSTTSTVSIDKSVNEDGDTIGSIMPDEKAEDAGEVAGRMNNRELLYAALGKLPERSREILVARFGLNGEEPEILNAIGERFGLTRERIRQIEMKAKRQLREELRKLENPANIEGLEPIDTGNESRATDMLLRGYHVREVSNAVGIYVKQVNQIHKELIGLGHTMNCKCGLDGQHKGWCRARALRYPKPNKDMVALFGPLKSQMAA